MGKQKHRIIVRSRDSETGEFVTEEYAKRHPRTTERERIKVHKK